VASLNELTAENSGSYPDRIAAQAPSADATAANTELVNQLIALQKKQNDLNEAKPKSVGDRLTSLPGILALLGGGTAAALGGEAGQSIGAGLIGTAVGGAISGKKDDEASLAAAQKATNEEIDKQRTRLTTLLQSRPEMFIDPVTEESLIDPRLIGYAATGLMLPINPAMNNYLAKQTAGQKARVDLGMDLLKTGDTPAKRRQGAVILDHALKLNLGADFYMNAAGSDERTLWNSLHANPKLDEQHTLEAHVYALTHGLSLDDPSVIGMLAPVDPRSTPMTMDSKILELGNYFNKRIREAGPAIQQLGWEEQVDWVFKGERSGDALLFRKFLAGTTGFNSGVSGSTLIGIAQRMADLKCMLFDIDPTADMFVKAGITSKEQILNNSMNEVQTLSGAYLQGQEDAATQNYGLKLQHVQGKLATEHPEWDEYMVNARSVAELERIKAACTEAGTFDVKKFNTMVSEYLGVGAQQ
jgi:hypothetical protein